MNYFPIREKVQLPYQVFYFPPTHFFREKLLLWKGSILSNEYLAFGSVIEGVPNCLLWVSYEDIFLRFGFELIRMKLFHISITTPNFKTRQLWFLAKPRFILCCLNGLRWCPFLTWMQLSLMHNPKTM